MWKQNENLKKEVCVKISNYLLTNENKLKTSLFLMFNFLGYKMQTKRFSEKRFKFVPIFVSIGVVLMNKKKLKSLRNIYLKYNIVNCCVVGVCLCDEVMSALLLYFFLIVHFVKFFP